MSHPSEEYAPLESSDEISLANFDDIKLQEHSPESNQSTDDSPDQEAKKNGGNASGFINSFQGYQSKIKQRITEPPSWSELLHNICEFLQKPSVLIAAILLLTLIYLSAQNGAMQRELDQMHQKVDKFGTSEQKMQKDFKSMTKTMKDVKKVEDDLVKKEGVLEKKENQLEQTVKEGGSKMTDPMDDMGFGQVHMMPLMPHMGPPRGFAEAIHALGQKIQDRVKNMRNDMDDKEHHEPHDGGKPAEDDGMPHIRIIRMNHPPPFFPGFLNFDDEMH